jgi:hypothetical protein
MQELDHVIDVRLQSVLTASTERQRESCIIISLRAKISGVITIFIIIKIRISFSLTNIKTNIGKRNDSPWERIELQETML